jgi:hypothetical protein
MGFFSMGMNHVCKIGHTVNGKVYLQENGRSIGFHQTKALFHSLVSNVYPILAHLASQFTGVFTGVDLLIEVCTNQVVVEQ